MATDERGLEMTGATSAQAVIFDSIMHDFCTYRLSAFPRLKQLCSEAPGFALAQVFKGYLMLSIGSQDTVPAAKSSAELVDTYRESLLPYELSHLSALSAWISGDSIKACRHWDEALFEQPHDLLALKLQHTMLFQTGNSEHMRDAAARALAAWNEGVPGLAHVKGMMAFAHEETGNYRSAERLGKEATELCPDDLWAIHSVSHVYEMQGRLNEGISWLDQPFDRWEDRNPFRGHLWWHAALFAFEKGAFDRVLNIYDRAIKPADGAFYLDVQNMASLLARLEFAKVDVGERWTELADVIDEKQGDHVVIFTEPHYTMALGKTGRFDKIEHQLESLEKFATQPDSHAAAQIDALVSPVCVAIRDYYKKDFESSTTKMMDLRYSYQAIGGSHAQRDVFACYLIDSAIQSNQLTLARALLVERVIRHPNSHSSWNRYAQVCKKIGDDTTSKFALDQVERIAGSA